MEARHFLTAEEAQGRVLKAALTGLGGRVREGGGSGGKEAEREIKDCLVREKDAMGMWGGRKGAVKRRG